MGNEMMADVDARTRSIEERLTRLRKRLKEARGLVPSQNGVVVVVNVDTLHGVMLGILDLLDDEL